MNKKPEDRYRDYQSPHLLSLLAKWRCGGSEKNEETNLLIDVRHDYKWRKETLRYNYNCEEAIEIQCLGTVHENENRNRQGLMLKMPTLFSSSSLCSSPSNFSLFVFSFTLAAWLFTGFCSFGSIEVPRSSGASMSRAEEEVVGGNEEEGTLFWFASFFANFLSRKILLIRRRSSWMALFCTFLMVPIERKERMRAK